MKVFTFVSMLAFHIRVISFHVPKIPVADPEGGGGDVRPPPPKKERERGRY